MPMKKKRKSGKISAVVPKVVYNRVFVGVVPACVAVGVACTGGGSGSSSGITPQGVAAVAYACFDGSSQCAQGVAAVAYACFDGGQRVPCYATVANSAFSDAGDASSDAPHDGPDSG
jgi:hypothetical protein